MNQNCLFKEKCIAISQFCLWLFVRRPLSNIVCVEEFYRPKTNRCWLCKLPKWCYQYTFFIQISWLLFKVTASLEAQKLGHYYIELEFVLDSFVLKSFLSVCRLRQSFICLIRGFLRRDRNTNCFAYCSTLLENLISIILFIYLHYLKK